MIIEEKLVPKAFFKDFGDTGLEENATFEKYEDDSVEGTPDELAEELELSPDILTYFQINASIVLPQGGRLAWGEDIRYKRDVDVNPIGQNNQDPILDACQY